MTTTALLLLLSSLCGSMLALPFEKRDELASAQRRLDQESAVCASAARAQVDADAGITHYLGCLAAKLEGHAQDSPLTDISQTLSEILSNPLFRDAGSRKKRSSREDPRFVRGKKGSEPVILDEKLIQALARSPEALRLVVDFLEKEEKKRKRERLRRGPTTTQQKKNKKPSSSWKQQRPQQWQQQQIQRRVDSPAPQSRRPALLPPPAPPARSRRPVDNPLVNGDAFVAERDLQFFGPADYKPDTPYRLPGRTLDTFGVLPWQIGFVPIPR